MTYLVRDGRLFELVAEDLRRNYGHGASLIREVALRDVVTEDVRFVTGETIATYAAVLTEAAVSTAAIAVDEGESR
jgi:hypothetical protein